MIFRGFGGLRRADDAARSGVDLAAKTVVGLPRSNLVKKPSELPRPVAPAPAPAPFAVPNPFAADGPFAGADPFAREPYATKADSVEVEVQNERAPKTYRDATGPVDVSVSAAPPPMRGQYASSPSTNELLERAAALGPARMTWESIVLPDDPILHEKRTPHVAERRARLTRVVKITLAACLGVCVLALGVSALSGDSSDSRDSSATATASASVGKTVASKGIVPVEPLDGTKHGKAARRVAPAVTTAAIVRSKRR